MNPKSICVLILGLVCISGWCNDSKRRWPKWPKPPKTVVAEVDVCVKRLGADNFRVRRKATKRLIEIGSFAKPSKEGGVRPYETYVYESMQKLFTHKDPEVSLRAHLVVKKLTPLPDVSKFVKLPHFVDQTNDTLEIIAEMYGSKVKWIEAANPSVKNDADLRKTKEIQVPVEDLN